MAGSLSHFDERGGRVECTTNWGCWFQTVAEVFVHVQVPKGTRGKQMNIRITTSELYVSRCGEKIFGGRLHRPVRPDESTWTLEDGEKVTILLTKAQPAKSEHVWNSLLEDDFKADPMTLLEMTKKLDLEKFQIENPGFDFSGAELSKKYD